MGNIWCATEGGTLTKFDGQNWTVYTPPTSSEQYPSPSFDLEGNLWIGSWGGGLVKFDGQNWTVYNTSNSGLPHNRAWATAIDNQGNVWIGTNSGGLAKFDGVNDWTVYNTSNSGLPDNRVGPLSFDSQGNLWIGTENGLAKFDGQNWTAYKTDNSGLPNNIIRALTIDAHDNRWIGTFGGGLVCFNEVNWVVYNTSNSGLPDDNLYCITESEGSVWIGTESSGLAVFRPQPVVDLNGNGIFDIDDLVKVIENWGTDESLCDIIPMPCGDGIVDKNDLEVFMTYWGQELEDPTLIAHWPLDETEGDIAYDSVGSCDGILYNEPLWQPDAGMIDGALELDGINDYVNTPFVLDPYTGPFSVFAWIKGGAPGQVILSQTDGVNWLSADSSDGCLMTELRAIGGRTGTTPLVSSALITDGDWHRIGCVWDGVNRILYVDDFEVASDAQSHLTGSEGGMYIGAGNALDEGTLWTGLIDDVRIYDRVITP